MRVSRLLLFFMFSFVLKTVAQNIDSFSMYLEASNQVIFITTPSWASTAGTASLYERKSTTRKWKCVASFAVTVGRNGLAWDNETKLPKYFTPKIKHEGDGNSPAGIFSLGPVFSYHTMENINMPFEQVDSNDLCVDDRHSIYYNQLVDADTLLKKDFSSFEFMKRKDQLYEFGVWVNYNSNPAKAGNGSCIFLHVWQNESSPTSGCTAMSRENMTSIIYWLDEKKNPVLVQVSREK
ncbi:MAG: L,D-transpeptidase [Chitinophagales bacterium]